ncbi:MAG: hypothetical protein V2I40_02740 [Desulfobacteraceae bacterium]|jgi:hypothetical protein|nr:hypothetical protein [Desulfobacteraceae bacterium]
MDNKQIAKQMIQFNKAVFDNSFKAMTMVVEQNEKMTESFFTQATWLPEEGKEAIRKWVSAYRTGFYDFKKLMDDNYAKVEAFFEKV